MSTGSPPDRYLLALNLTANYSSPFGSSFPAVVTVNVTSVAGMCVGGEGGVCVFVCVCGGAGVCMCVCGWGIMCVFQCNPMYLWVSLPNK